ncbi:MAG: signal peptide peptidase SppA [Kiritimatiellae bacterium]|nr:signal peptide peptidase SppA [Kiritimatiellia bacterium]
MEDCCNGQERAPARKTSFFGGCFTGCLLALIIMVGLPVVMMSCAVTKVAGVMGGGMSALTEGSGRDGAAYTYVWRWGNGGDKCAKVARLALEGVIMKETPSKSLFLLEEDKENELLSQIEFVTDDDEISGIWIDIDSPGGEVTLSDDIRHALEVFRTSRRGRFVFARFCGLACSGGYYVATAADYIMAEPTTITGSIGVIMPGFNAAGLAEKLGIRSVNIASSENKAILDPLEPVNPEHVALLKSVVDEEYERFLSLVSESRRIPKDELRPVADGRVLTARQALAAKLIDDIGYEEDAMMVVEKLAAEVAPDSDGVRIYRLKGEDGLFRFPSSLKLSSGIPAIADALSALGVAGGDAPAALSPASRPEYRHTSR